MIKVKQLLLRNRIAAVAFGGLLVAALLCAAKGYKGHLIDFEPTSISVELALNGAGRQTISLVSQETLYDVVVWITPEIAPFVSVESSELGTVEAGWIYDLDLDFMAPENAVPGCYDGTIHLRVGNRTVARPLPVSIEVLDERVSLSEWPYRRCDLTGTSCNPYGSIVATGTTLADLFNIPGADYYILTGDVDGDWETEIVTTGGSLLKIYSGTGDLEQTIALPRACQLSMLEDADGDGILDIGLGGSGDGFAAYIYRYDGILLQSFAGLHAGSYTDRTMIPLTISNGKVLMGYNAGYARTPRGVASFDYATGLEDWYYQVGPANGWYSIADMDGNGVLDVTMNSHTVHNGASGNGTTDGDIYLVVVNETGAMEISRKYPSPGNGYAYHIFADMNGDGIQEILGFESHDPVYYQGQAQIHIYDNAGNILQTFDGPMNTGWDYAVGDLDGDGMPEIVATAKDANLIYVLDNQLQLITMQAVEGNVKLICDLTGDGSKEIVLLTADGLLKVLDSSLAVLDQVQCGSKNGNVIASDVNGDGIVELLVQTDQLYVLSMGENTTAGRAAAADDTVLEWAIQGTWKLDCDGGSVRIKTIRDGKWLVEQRNPETGAMIYRHGGSCTLDGNRYVENVEYANESTAFLVGNSHVFEVSIEGDVLHQIGIGNHWTEDWRRVE